MRRANGKGVAKGGRNITSQGERPNAGKLRTGAKHRQQGRRRATRPISVKEYGGRQKLGHGLGARKGKGRSSSRDKAQGVDIRTDGGLKGRKKAGMDETRPPKTRGGDKDGGGRFTDKNRENERLRVDVIQGRDISETT